MQKRSETELYWSCRSILLRNNKGFTLIELLVVIVIIGILATITTATYTNSIEKARDVKKTVAVRDMAQRTRAYIAANAGNTHPDMMNGTGSYAVRTSRAANMWRDMFGGDYNLPEIEGNTCYGLVSCYDGVRYGILTYGENTSTNNPAEAGLIYESDEGLKGVIDTWASATSDSDLKGLLTCNMSIYGSEEGADGYMASERANFLNDTDAPFWNSGCVVLGIDKSGITNITYGT